MINFNTCFDAVLIAVTMIGLLQAFLKVKRIQKRNKIPGRTLFGLWFMYVATLIFICLMVLDDLGYPGFREVCKFVFLAFLIVAMPWSTNQVR